MQPHLQRRLPDAERLGRFSGRVALQFPQDALPQTQELTLRLTDVTGLPFTRDGGVAVRLEPEDLVIRHPLVLEITPRNTSGEDRFIGFAIRKGEVNLHPVMHLEVPSGARSQNKVRLLLGTAGTHGIGIASPSELAVVARHLPTDAIARIEQKVALAFIRPTRTATLPAFVAFMQIAPRPVTPPSESPSGWLQQLLESIRDTYEDVVLPGIDGIPHDDCLSPALWEAIKAYVRWSALNQLLLPVQATPELLQDPQYAKSHDLLVAERLRMLRERGFTDSQIEEIDREIEKYRQTFEETAQRVADMLREEMKRAFYRLHRCCMTQKPLQYHLDAMGGILRAAALISDENLIADPWTPLRECACRIASAAKGSPEGFFGTITQKETLEIDETWKSPGGGGRMQRTKRNTRSLSYEMTLTVMRALTERTMHANASAEGRDDKFVLVSDDYGVCTVATESLSRLEGRAEEPQTLSLHLRPKQGVFSISFNPLGADGFEHTRSRRTVSGSGCNPFEVKRNSIRGISRMGSVPGSNVDIVNEPYDPKSAFLRGSRTFEGERRDNVRSTVEVRWDLRRCGQ